MKNTVKILLGALAVCLIAAITVGISVTAAAADEKNGEFNGSPAHVDTDGNLCVDEANFPDEIFRGYVSTEFDADKNGVLSKEEAAGVTDIDIRDKGLQTLDGIRYFTSLKTLDCSGNSLTELDVSGLTGLTKLYCYGNNLTALNVGSLTGLTSFHCSDNSLTELDVSGLKGLIQLYCYGNDLTALDVSSLTGLTNLACGSNSLTELDVSSLTGLTSLSCDGNSLTELDVSDLAALTYFDCADNNLTELELGGITGITHFNCSNNKLTELDVKDLTKLDVLNCSNNDLTVLDIGKFTELSELRCDGNKITALDLSGCYRIRTVILGKYVNISDVKLNENAKPENMSFAVNSTFDREKNVWKVYYAEYLEYINNILDAYNAPIDATPFLSASATYEREGYSDRWGSGWIIDSNDESDYPSSFDPESDITYYWIDYEDGSFVGQNLNDHPELADYYKKEISFIEYGALKTRHSDSGWWQDQERLYLTVYITPEPSISDEDEGIIAEYPKTEDDVYSGAVLNAEELKSGDGFDLSKSAFGAEYGKFIPYSITLTDKDGKAIPVSSKLTVKVPVPDGWDADKTLVFYVGEDGKTENMNAKATEDGKYVVFEATHFSFYTLVDTSSKLTPPTPGGETKPGGGSATPPETSDRPSVAAWLAVTLIALTCATAAYASVKRERYTR